MIYNNITKWFDKNIDVYIYTPTANAYGELIKAWNKDRTIAGRIRPLSGSEQFITSARHQISTHRLYTDDANIREIDQIVFGSNTFNVVFVGNPMHFNEFYQIDLGMLK